jgi:hypothetical protein
MDSVIVLILMLFFYGLIIRIVCWFYDSIRESYLWILGSIHIVLSATYIIYSLTSATDSRKYFKVSANSDSWLTLFDTGTSFISFLTWPFTRFLGLSYYPVMFLFSFFGLLGILFLYIDIKTVNLLNIFFPAYI